MKRIFEKTWKSARRLNRENILSLIYPKPKACMLDCGCGNGDFTLEVANKLQTNRIYGVEACKDFIRLSESKNIKVKEGDLNKKIPYESNFFDLVVSDQVIEHLQDTDIFLDEIYRVLKKGAIAIISTENLASWHNIFALLLGWEPFSTTNFSCSKLGIGNPLANLRGESQRNLLLRHVKVFSYQGLKEFFEAKGFIFEQTIGAGYYPLPAFFGKIDPRHAAFITMKIRKP